MRKNRRVLAVLLACLMIMTLCPLQVSAAGKIVPEQDVSLNISYIYEEDGEADTAVSGAQFDLYKVADTDADGKMTLTKEFEPYSKKLTEMADINSLDSEGMRKLASTLKGYVQLDKAAVYDTGRTDANGLLTMPSDGKSMKPGLYLVVGYPVTDESGYTYTSLPFLVFLPNREDASADWTYNVTARPKGERTSETSTDIEVLKIWDDKGYEKLRPKEITVILLCDGEQYEPGGVQKLNSGNNWMYKWEDLDINHDWCVVESPLIDGYSISVSPLSNKFAVRNKYHPPEIVTPPGNDTPPGGKIPQTGMLWWPVSVLLFGGTLFITVGVYLRKRDEKN